MKFSLTIVVLAVVFVVTTSAPTDKELQQLFEKFVKECRVKENASTADIKAYTSDQVPPTKEGKCFVGCMFEKMGLIVNGAFSRSVADKMAYEDFPNNVQKIEAAKKIFKICETEIGPTKDKCITGPALLVCIERHDKKPPTPATI